MTLVTLLSAALESLLTAGYPHFSTKYGFARKMSYIDKFAHRLEFFSSLLGVGPACNNFLWQTTVFLGLTGEPPGATGNNFLRQTTIFLGLTGEPPGATGNNFLCKQLFFSA